MAEDQKAGLQPSFTPCPLCPQNGGALWPSETSKVRASRSQQDSRLGNISLIPLRGNESEMRNSVAAFATDPLTVSETGVLGGVPLRGGCISPASHAGGSWFPNLVGGRVVSLLPLLMYQHQPLVTPERVGGCV